MITTKKNTLLRCTQTTATIVFILLGSIFILTGCTQLYRIIGLSDEQTEEQVTKDQAARQQITNKIRLTTTELILTIASGLGAIATGFLARWLGTERKITKVLITGIENDDTNTIKETVHTKAIAAGIEPKLAARVRALT